MKSVPLTSYPRNLTGRNQVKKVRSAGRIPAVVYGRNAAPQNLEVSVRDLETLIKHSASENVLVDLSFDGDSGSKRMALIKEVQHHPLTGRVLHVDLHQVAEDEKVVVTIPVESVGESVGVKTGGGVLEHVLFSLKVRALPKDLPEVINVDVTNLNVGESYHISDLQAGEGVELLGDPKIVVISVAAGIAATREEGEAGVAPAQGQPEMIKERKEKE